MFSNIRHTFRAQGVGISCGLIGIFLALGGTSVAADAVSSAKKLITGKQIKNSSIASADVKNNSLTGSDVKNGSLLSQDFRAGQLPAGEQGPAGPKGDQGERGPQGPSVADSKLPSGIASCTLASGPNYCYDTGTFTAPSASRCQVSVNSSIYLGTTPAADGPYFRVAIKRGATNSMDDGFGTHFAKAGAGSWSTPNSRTALVSVAAGESVQFGAFYGTSSGDWVGKTASFSTSWICFTV